MSLKEIKDLINVMNEHDLSELELEKEGLKVRLVKSGSGKIIQQITESPQAALPQSVEPASSQPEELPGNTATIKTPMVGTFYSAPSPESPPYVEVGTEVEEGQVICIIEAMKLMNEIKAEVKGKVVKVLVSNGEPVEFGQELFVIEKSG